MQMLLLIVRRALQHFPNPVPRVLSLPRESPLFVTSAQNLLIGCRARRESSRFGCLLTTSPDSNNLNILRLRAKPFGVYARHLRVQKLYPQQEKALSEFLAGAMYS